MGEARLIRAEPLSAYEAAARVHDYRRYIDAALEYAEGRNTWALVAADIAAGLAVVWLITDGDKTVGAAVISLHDSGSLRWACIDHIGGDHMETWLAQALADAERWYLAKGCRQITFEGRRGWEKPLRELGFTTRTVIGRKVLK